MLLSISKKRVVYSKDFRYGEMLCSYLLDKLVDHVKSLSVVFYEICSVDMIVIIDKKIVIKMA